MEAQGRGQAAVLLEMRRVVGRREATIERLQREEVVKDFMSNQGRKEVSSGKPESLSKGKERDME